jgi:hypothetical protein
MSSFKIPKSVSTPTFNGQPAKKENNQHLSNNGLQRKTEILKLDYHLRQTCVTDNPKKLPKFDFIKVIPKGIEYAIYIKQTSIQICNMSSSIPVYTITHRSNHINTLLIGTVVDKGFCLITNILIYKDIPVYTYYERLTYIHNMFQEDFFTNINFTDENSVFSGITFNITHIFKNWLDFSRETIHIPYEIKYLEYCFYEENLNIQKDRFIYILNKKNFKKKYDLVYSNSRDFRIDCLQENNGTPLLDFKECILKNIPYVNIVGYSHLDKQEESDDDDTNN